MAPIINDVRHRREKRRKSSDAEKEKSKSKSGLQRIQVENLSTPQFAVVRPRPKRTTSGGSATGSKTGSRVGHTRNTSGGSSSMNIARMVPPSKNKSTSNLQSSSGRNRDAFPFDEPPPLYTHHSSPYPSLQPLRHSSTPNHHTPVQHPHPYPANPQPPPPALDPFPDLSYLKSAQNQHRMPIRRRADKLTPSTYTFGSDSTKLGEIPIHRWPEGTWDAEESARKNAEAAQRPMPLPVGKPRRGGLFALFRKNKTQDGDANLPVSVGA
jgi:hypothetical protein